MAQIEQSADEALQVGELVAPHPVDPRRRVVLVVGIVVATLGAPELVAHRHHRCAMRHRQQAPGVAQLASPQRQDFGRGAVVAFEPAVPRAVVACTVAVGVSVGLVVLAVVGDEVVHREAVVAGQEVDRLRRGVEHIRAALNALDQGGDTSTFAAEKAANVVAVAVVPLHPAPAGPRPPELVGAGGVPRLGDHPHAAASRPLVEPSDERPVTAEHGGEVEAEAVGAEVGEAVERHEDDVLGSRRGGVDVVAAPCRLDVRTVGVEAVVVAVGESAEAVRGAARVDLGRVVVDDVDPHLEVAVVGCGDQLGQLAGGVVAGRVLPVHGTEGQRHVSPVAAFLGVVLVNREQFEDTEAERCDAVEVADQGAVGAG